MSEFLHRFLPTDSINNLRLSTGPSSRLGPDQVRLRVPHTSARQLAPRDPRHATVQAARVRGSNQLVYGQRVGYPTVHHRYLHEAEGW